MYIRISKYFSQCTVTHHWKRTRIEVYNCRATNDHKFFTHCRVQQEALTFKVIIVVVHNLEVLHGDLPCRLILIHPHDTLQELHHLLAVLVPHGGACVNPGYRVRLSDGVVRQVGAGYFFVELL